MNYFVKIWGFVFSLMVQSFFCHFQQRLLMGMGRDKNARVRKFVVAVRMHFELSLGWQFIAALIMNFKLLRSWWFIEAALQWQWTPNCHLVDNLSGCIDDELQIVTLLMVYGYTDDELQIVTLLMVYEYTDNELQIVMWWINWRLKMKLLWFHFHPSCLKT